MARPGVTFTEVANAAAELAGQNRNPTIEQVRLIIGRGSTTTLATHLRRWKAQQAGDSLMAAREGIPEPLVAVMKGLWERVMREADIRMEKAVSEYDDIVSSLKEELCKYKTNNQRWQKLHEQWLKEKERLQIEIAGQNEQNIALRQQYNSLETCCEAQARQLAEKDARIAELNRLHQQVQQNLEHFRESSREQRLAESLAAEKREAALQQEIAELKMAVAKAQKGRAKAETALSISQKECAGLREAVSQTQQSMEQLQQAKHQIENENIRLQAAYDGLVKQEAGLRERYYEAQGRILELEKNAVVLESQVHTLRCALSSAEDRVVILEQEKQF